MRRLCENQSFSSGVSPNASRNNEIWFSAAFPRARFDHSGQTVRGADDADGITLLDPMQESEVQAVYAACTACVSPNGLGP